MSLRECWITDRRKESQQEVVADLHSCLEQLTFRCTEMEQKIDKCKESAIYHMQLSRKESSPAAIARELARARMFMQDRRRMQTEHDKALRSMHMLQQQIDSIVSSHVDMVIVDAMRGFNATAARMALPQKTLEIEKLSESLADRHHEVSTFQEIMGTVAFGPSAAADQDGDGEDSLMRELDEFMHHADDKKLVIHKEAIMMQLPSPPLVSVSTEEPLPVNTEEPLPVRPPLIITTAKPPLIIELASMEAS